MVYFRAAFERHGAAFVLFAILSLWSSYPVLAQPQSRIIGWTGDNVLYVYMTGWVADSILEGQSPFVDPYANYPDTLPLAANEAPFLSMILVAPLTWAFGPVFGYNSIMGLSALLSGLFMYLWIYRITGSRVGGIVAGIGFLLTPYRVVRTYGHINLISIQVLPLLFWALDSVIQHPRPTRRQLLAVGGAFFLVGCMSQYYLVICTLTGLGYSLCGLAGRWLQAWHHAALAAPPARSGRPRLVTGVARTWREWLVGAAGLAATGALWLGAGAVTYAPQQISVADAAPQHIQGPLSELETVVSGGDVFRWTMGPIAITLPDVSHGSWVVQLDVHTRHPDSAPTAATLEFSDGNRLSLPDATQRSIHLLVPRSAIADEALTVRLTSNLYREQSASARSLGVSLFGFRVQPMGARHELLGLGFGLFFALISLGAVLLLRLLGIRWAAAVGGGAILGAGGLMTAARFTLPWLQAAGLAVWAGVGILLLLQTVRAVPAVQGSLKYLVSAGVGAGLSALPYLITRLNSTDYKAYPIETTRWFSASPENFLVPSRLHPVWGDWIANNIPLNNSLENGWVEHTAYLGAVCVLLAVVALVWRRTPYRTQVSIWAGTILIALLFAFGTDLHLNGRSVSDVEPVWLPMYYLGQLPVVNLMRVWARFSIVVILLTSAMAGVGAAQIYSALKGRRRWATLAAVSMILLVCIDLAPGRLESFQLAPRPIDRWLAEQPGAFAAAFLPTNVEAFPALFGTLTHKKAIPAFNHYQHKPAAYEDFTERVKTFPDQASLQQLHDLKLRYLIINLKYYNAAQRSAMNTALTTTAHGQIVTHVDEWLIFRFN